jgi:hypothetical protein
MSEMRLSIKKLCKLARGVEAEKRRTHGRKLSHICIFITRDLRNTGRETQIQTKLVQPP